MAGKKDFAGMNTGRTYTNPQGQKVTIDLKNKEQPTGQVFKSIEQATSKKGQQGKASPQEQAERAAELKTQGRKGCKATRINMAFTPDNHEFIKVMAKATGRTMTELTNDVIAAYRNEHPEFMEKAAGFLEFINSGEFSTKNKGRK